MTPNRPYLLRALYDWIVDNGMTPYLLVDAEKDGVLVPRDYVDNGRIVLNVAPSAVQRLVLGNDEIRFSARFGGRPHTVELPVFSVLGIYARENGHGMIFPEEEAEDAGTSGDPAAEAGTPRDEDGGGAGGDKDKRPALRVVK
jgi:stringent starvation protein B